MSLLELMEFDVAKKIVSSHCSYGFTMILWHAAVVAGLDNVVQSCVPVQEVNDTCCRWWTRTHLGHVFRPRANFSVP